MPAVKVLVVDDSAVIRRLVTTVLEGDPDIHVLGTANNGAVALERIAELHPDLVTLDVEMPVMDGLTALREIRRRWPTLPVIMFSTLTERGAAATIDALVSGASDYVTKPSNVGSFAAGVEAVKTQLVPKIKALCHRTLTPAGARTAAPTTRTATTSTTPVARSAGVTLASRSARSHRPEILVIGASTGGPDALCTVLRELPANFPIPIAIVQHMPPLFTKMFADRLDRISALSVFESVGGEELRPGTVFVAPGDHHLELRREGGTVKTALSSAPPENYCRPAVDVLFRSAANLYNGGVLACVLTGMGHDGGVGSKAIVAAGGTVIVQDERTSVVWGMPGTVANAGSAAAVLPLDRIADALTQAARSNALVGTP